MNHKINRRLKKFQKEKAETAAIFKRLHSEAKSAEEREGIEAEAYHETRMIEFSIDSLITDSLVDHANRLLVPIPERSIDKWWSDSTLTDKIRHLSPEGIHELKRRIREEIKARSETRAMSVDLAAKIITILTGLVGAAIGLAAILKS